eukprot:9444902-Heterocapsa_arctica.AAC.1
MFKTTKPKKRRRQWTRTPPGGAGMAGSGPRRVRSSCSSSWTCVTIESTFSFRMTKAMLSSGTLSV